MKKKLEKSIKKKFQIFLASDIPGPPMSVHNKFQPNAGYMHTYIYMNVLFYFID